MILPATISTRFASLFIEPKPTAMKNVKLLLTIALAFVVQTAFSQGSTIDAITIVPANPTTNDAITVYVDYTFPTMSCDMASQGHSVNGNTVLASTLHCLGQLTAICNDQDTFLLGQLPAGSYTFDLTLSTGFGGFPCSPGIVPDDSESAAFTVTQTNAINENQLPSIEFQLLPNPANEYFTIKSEDSQLLIGNTLSIYALDGKIVQQTILTDSTPIYTGQLAPGIYVVTITGSAMQPSIQKLAITR
jgi:hypothetical protein